MSAEVGRKVKKTIDRPEDCAYNTLNMKGDRFNFRVLLKISQVDERYAWGWAWISYVPQASPRMRAARGGRMGGKMELALIGAGNRGMTYAAYAFEKKGVRIAAVVEPNADRRERAAQQFDIPAARCFASAEDFFKAGRICEAAIIASLDRDHYEEVMEALDAGYDLLLEKPISPNPAECLAIQEKAQTLGRKITVCHVLRYTNFFSRIKEIIDSGTLGRLVSIDHSENIGNFHMAHSFVRGNWRNSEQSSPIIMQKSCHDCDLLVWFTGSAARAVSSFGSLTYFKKENAPEGAGERCLECGVAQHCRYDALKAYLPVS